MIRKFKTNVLNTFKNWKDERFSEDLPNKLPIYNSQGDIIAFLKPITKSILRKDGEIKLLAKWRDENSFAFASQFKVTFGGTKKWTKGLIENPTRILFFIESKEKKSRLIGHIGLFTFNFRSNSCEIDNVVRGDKENLKGVMSFALKSLINWSAKKLKPKHLYLRVLDDNKRAIDFYRRNGFKDLYKIPLKKHEKPGMVSWEEERGLKKAEKYFLKMTYIPQL